MLRDAGATGVILGHSERRQLFGETDESLARKVLAALAGGLEPILCVGESDEQREAGETEDVLRRQLEADLADGDAAQLAEVVIAYEPIWAIGTGKTATPEQAQEACAFARSVLAERDAPAASSPSPRSSRSTAASSTALSAPTTTSSRSASPSRAGGRPRSGSAPGRAPSCRTARVVTRGGRGGGDRLRGAGGRTPALAAAGEERDHARVVRAQAALALGNGPAHARSHGARARARVHWPLPRAPPAPGEGAPAPRADARLAHLRRPAHCDLRERTLPLRQRRHLRPRRCASLALVAQAEFDAGRPLEITGASLLEDPSLDGSAVDLDVSRPAGGPDIVREVYALGPDRIDLVRLERADGRAAASRGIGPPPPDTTERGLRADLESRERRRVLRALVWMSERRGWPEHTALEDRVRALAASTDAWIAEAARAALEEGKP